MCTPLEIPEDDSVHRFSNYRCMNQTRPYSFQNQGCAARSSTPVRIDYPTPTLDLSSIYDFESGYAFRNREYEGGRLKVEVVNGREFPSDGNSSCMIQDAIETGCTRYVPNGFMGLNMGSILMWNLHNLCAHKLEELNPSWSDDKIFFTARDLVKGFYSQILIYELWPLLLGTQNMLEKGIIIKDQTNYRDIYDENVPVKTILENAMVHRYFHKMVSGTQHKITPNGTYVGSVQVVDYNNKVELLSNNDDIVTILHGSLQQGAGDSNCMDPDMADKGLGPLQDIADVGALDIHKDGLFGFQSYVKYRDLCTNYSKRHETFEDLRYIMPEETLDILQELYEHPEDIGLMAGIYVENFIKDGHVPDTAACVIMEQLYLNIRSDRHWYERPNRPNAFTPAQFKEIRKSTVAGLLCMVGFEFTHVQRHAFLRPGPKNPVVSCDDIPKIDFSAWKEETSDC